jgi:hypothetical protein
MIWLKLLVYPTEFQSIILLFAKVWLSDKEAYLELNLFLLVMQNQPVVHLVKRVTGLAYGLLGTWLKA